jgi:hypothetical protein
MKGSKSPHEGNKMGTIEVEQVLYGHWPAKKLEFTDRWNPNERMLYSFGPAQHQEVPALHLCHVMSAEDLEAAQALCRARLHTLALDAHSIFEGEEMGEPTYEWRKVKVLRSIDAEQFQPDSMLQVALHHDIRSNGPSRARPGPLIYFTGLYAEGWWRDLRTSGATPGGGEYAAHARIPHFETCPKSQ